MDEHTISPAGDPFYAAFRRDEAEQGNPEAETRGLSFRDQARILVISMNTEPCEGCGAVDDMETPDGVPLCEGCAD